MIGPSMYTPSYGVQSWTKVDCMTQTEMNGRLALGSSKKMYDRGIRYSWDNDLLI